MNAALYGAVGAPPPVRDRIDAALPLCRRKLGTVIHVPEGGGPCLELPLADFAAVLRRNGIPSLEGASGLLARLAAAVTLAGCAALAVDAERTRHVVPVISR